MDIIPRLDNLIQERSLLRHRFYKAWSAGELDQESLAGYSKEYFQLVKAVPDIMDGIVGRAPAGLMQELAENRDEEADHVEPWRMFAKSLGVSDIDGYEGLPKTREAVGAMRSLDGTFEGGAAAMYAFEQEIPKISQTKLDGLAEFYGIDSEDATLYFRLHREADVRHAASWRRIIESAPELAHESMLGAAVRSLDAQNLLLDACFEGYCE